MATDQPSPSPEDPIVRAASVSDIPCNTRHNTGGDVWFDVVDDFPTYTAWDILNENHRDIAWDILNENTQDVAWDILNAFAINLAWDILNTNTQDTSWSIFAKTLYFIQQFFVKAICFDYNILEPVLFNNQILKPLEWTFHPTGTIVDTAYLEEEAFDTITIANVIDFDFQLKEPINFTIGTAIVLHGESDTQNKG
jgi:hypothetical protein